METPILQYAGGVIAAKLDRTEKELVHGVSFHISPGESLALIGETGSGKTLIAQSVMGVLPGNVRLVSGEISFCGKALPKGKKLRSMLGREIVYIPQNGHEFLDPSRSIRRQMFDSIAKLGIAAPLREALAREKLTQVGFTQPEAILDRYAFQLSGGMATDVAAERIYDDYYRVTDYDREKEVFLYSFEKNGLIYTFVGQDQQGTFSYYSITEAEGGA